MQQDQKSNKPDAIDKKDSKVLIEQWANLDNNMKFMGVVVATIGSIAIMASFGPNALYLLIGAVTISTFAIYPEIEPERVIWGAVIGAVCAGPLGLIAGAALGHYLGKRYDDLARRAEPYVTKIVEVASATVTTVSTTAGPLVVGPISAVRTTASAIVKARQALSAAFSAGFSLIQPNNPTQSEPSTVEDAKKEQEPHIIANAAAAQNKPQVEFKSIEAQPSNPMATSNLIQDAPKTIITQEMLAIENTKPATTDEIRLLALKETSKTLQFNINLPTSKQDSGSEPPVLAEAPKAKKTSKRWHASTLLN
ncbi:MAG: MFS transporter [Proteobacteria bacterium]|nr:MFS transporter [Pseudomonadota bacterium]